MTNSKPRALIVCLTFPPMPGVGARRWVKTAVKLKELGWHISVLSGMPNSNDISPWTDDIHDMDITRLPNLYPVSLNKPAVNLVEKLRYRFDLFSSKLKTKGNYYDRGIGWEKQFYENVYRLIQLEKIDTLIVTGGPFSFLYYGAMYKLKHPTITYVADIRDEWGNDNFYGFGGLDLSRKKEEMKRLHYVLQNADYVLVPYQTMADMYSAMEPQAKDRIVLYPHGVDDTKIIGGEQSTNNNKTMLVNFGSIHSGQELHFQAISKVLEKLKSVHLHFYTAEKKYSSLFQYCDERVSYNQPVSESEVFQVMKNANAALIFIPDYFKDNLATKFMETFANRTPVFAIGVKGKVSDFITENRLGVFLEYSRIEQDFEDALFTLKNLRYNENFNFTPYTYSYLALQLEKMLNRSLANQIIHNL